MYTGHVRRSLFNKYPWLYFVIAGFMIVNDIFEFYPVHTARGIYKFLIPGVMIAMGIYSYIQKRKIDQWEKEQANKTKEE